MGETASLALSSFVRLPSGSHEELVLPCCTAGTAKVVPPSRHTRADAAHRSGAGSKRTKMVEVLR